MADGALVALIQNASFLLGMAVVYGLATARWTLRRGPFGPVLVGLFLGTIGVVIMLTPWTLTPGIIFDTRSVLLSVTGLFFGPVPTLVAMAMTAALRIAQGGEAAGVGVAVIVASGLIGLAWRRLRRGRLEDATIRELYLLGLVVSVVMLAIMLALPGPIATRVLGAVALPVLVIYPVATGALGGVLVNHLRREGGTSRMRVNEERLRLALEAADQALYDVDLRTDIVTVNDEYARMLGYDPRGFRETKAGWFERMHPDDRELMTQTFADCVAGRRPGFRTESRERTRPGGWKWILSLGEIVEWDGAGAAVRMIGTRTDITVRREAEQEAKATEALRSRALAEASTARRALLSVVEDLRGSEEELREVADRYRLLVNNAPNAIFVNRDDGVVLANKACVALFGASTEDELLTKSPFDLFHPDDHEAIRERMQRMRDLRVPVPAREERIIRVDGRVVDVEVSASPFVDHGAVSIHVVLREITERKQAEDALRLAAAELEQRVRDRTAELQDTNRELESFVYSVSHDLRAPLRAVSGFSQILERRHSGALNDDARHLVSNVVAASTQMGRLIDDLLLYSRVGRRAVRLEPVPLEPIVERLSMTFSDRLEEPGARLEAESPLVTPIGDPTLMEQVLTNLVGNALTYRRVGIAPVVRITSRRVDGEVVIDVADNGIGIAPEYRDSIFDVFTRLHSDEAYSGTGIGLAIARRAARFMDGDITVASEPGTGSTFTLHLRRRRADGAGHG